MQTPCCWPACCRMPSGYVRFVLVSSAWSLESVDLGFRSRSCTVSCSVDMSPVFLAFIFSHLMAQAMCVVPLPSSVQRLPLLCVLLMRAPVPPRFVEAWSSPRLVLTKLCESSRAKSALKQDKTIAIFIFGVVCWFWVCEAQILADSFPNL